MPKRTYWDRSLFKEVREVYKPLQRKFKKAKYVSKAYRAALEYHIWRFMDGDYSSSRIHLEVSKALTYNARLQLMGRLANEHITSVGNSLGFMRSYMATLKGEFVPTHKQTDSPWYHNYKLESPGPYKAKKAYTIPPRDQWVKWKEPEAVKNQCNSDQLNESTK